MGSVSSDRSSESAAPTELPAGRLPEPVFVVGMNGSGTTMLLDCLGRHPALYAFPKETRLIPHLMGRVAAFGDLKVDDNYRRLWQEVQGLEVFREVNGHQPLELPGDWRTHDRSLAGVLDGVFRVFAARQEKRRWCEKTPQHVQHLTALAEHFPAARFIHVIRDGRDCAASFHRRWHRQPELTIFRWKRAVAKGCDQGERLGRARYLEVLYENLTTRPEESLRQICEFLGVPFHEATLESAQPYLEAQPDGARRGLRRNSGKWQSHFPDAMQQRLERIAGRTLARFGYATRFPDGDRNITSWQRRYWSATESMRQYGSEIWEKLNGRIARPWRVILVKPFNAVRQRRHIEY